MGKAWGWAGLLSLLLLAGCGVEPAATTEAALPQQEPQFLAENMQWRLQRQERLLQPDGWASLIGLYWMELKAHYLGSGGTNGMRLALGPEKLGMLEQQGGRVFLIPHPGVELVAGETAVKGRIELLPDTSATPTLVGFDQGKGQLSLLQRGSRKALRVKHADAPTRRDFAGLDYWPADASWRIEARFVPYQPARTLEVMDITSTLQPLANPGVVAFSRDGRDFRLEALAGSDGGLFLIFADRTSGHGSYGAGRYLETGAPDAQGRVVLDFNRAYNPPCAFTPYATCPLPPAENRLDLAVTAGEMKYAGS